MIINDIEGDLTTRIAEYLRKQEDGQTVEQLAARFKTPSGLIRKALELLRKERFVFSLPGGVWKFDYERRE